MFKAPSRQRSPHVSAQSVCGTASDGENECKQLADVGTTKISQITILLDDFLVLFFSQTGLRVWYHWRRYKHSLKFYAVNNSFRSRGFRRPIGRRDILHHQVVLRLGITIGVQRTREGQLELHTNPTEFLPYQSPWKVIREGY